MKTTLHTHMHEVSMQSAGKHDVSVHDVDLHDVAVHDMSVCCVNMDMRCVGLRSMDVLDVGMYQYVFFTVVYKN
jgi:hypothetical protein